MNILRLLAVWFGLVIGAILNGTFRQFVLIPQLGDATAHVLSSIMLSGIILLVTHVTFPLLRIHSPIAAWKAGLFWLTMTLLFEFGFGHFIMGKPWSLLLEDYNVMAGRIWILILIVTVSAPRIILQLRKG
jgi:hypothetical protein